MQSSLTSVIGSSRLPYRSDQSTSSRTVSDYQPSITPPRVVIADGSEFLLERVPRRGSPSAIRSPTKDRRVSVPHASSSSSPLPRSSPSRAVSTSSTSPSPRSRQADRPYRPPPSSSARFYERQTQRWLLQQPTLPPQLQAQLPPAAAHLQREPEASVSSLTPPRMTTRARSGSDASSFTRSRPNHVHDSTTDEESVDDAPFQPILPIMGAHMDPQSLPDDAYLVTASHDIRPGLQQFSRTHHAAPQDDVFGTSADTDWDTELGISDVDHAEPLRLPQLQQADSVPFAAPRHPAGSNNALTQRVSHLQNIDTANLKGIRVTSTVSETWDEDFLFQNDEEPVNADLHDSSHDQQQEMGSAKATGPTTSQSVGKNDPQSDEDVENWDDEFSWNADQMITPSASSSSYLSLRLDRPDNGAHDPRAHGRQSPLSALLPGSSRQLDGERQLDKAVTKQRLLQELMSSETTGPPAPPAAQHNADVSRTQIPKSSGGITPSRHTDALDFIRNERQARHSTDDRGNNSGGDTETEPPPKENIAPDPARSARRSLGAALGFHTRPKSAAAAPTSASTQSPSRVKPRISSPDSAKTHSTAQPKPKVGALQRLSFSRSRLSVGNVSSASIDELPEAVKTPQRPYNDRLNESQASVLSHVSASSNRSQRGDSSTSLERSYSALRSTSFRRFFGRSDKGSKNDSHTSTTPKSPSTSSTEPSSGRNHPSLHVSSPAKDDLPALTSDSLLPSARFSLRRSIELTPSRGVGVSTNPGLRRDFSSTNTLRAASGHGTVDAVASTRTGRSVFGEDAGGFLQDVESDLHAHVRPDGPFGYPGGRMLLKSEHYGSASRSVSASTAHSHASSESMYGYKMRKQISVSSGPDALDSETSYGTSVGSSPGLANSSWASYRKGGPNASMDTKDVDISASADMSTSQDTPLQHESAYGRKPSAASFVLAPERTLDGAPMLGLPSAARKQSSLNSPASDLEDTTSTQEARAQFATAIFKAPRQALPNVTELGSSPDKSATLLSSTGPVTSAVKRAPRRNSLGDLKIPSRISKAQTGIRHNITLVRDFAKGIEELKILKESYMTQKMSAPLLSPDAEERIRNWLDCADVLIGLGEGRTESDSTARVDTLTHTPIPAQNDSRRTTFSDASAGPTPSFELPMSRLPSLSGARSASGTSQGTTSTTDGGRSVDIHREIDILSAILGGAAPTTDAVGAPRSHGRFQSDTYARGYAGHHSATLAFATPQPKVVRSSTRVSTQTTLERTEQESLSGLESPKERRATRPERQFNIAPALSGVDTSLTDTSISAEIDVGDINRSAKRRLRSASRAGLQGLKELLKGFRSGAADDNGTPVSRAGATSRADTTTEEAKEQSRYSIDGRPTTPSATKQKRKSLTMKRRSFLRSRTSLDSVQTKDLDMLTAERVAPPLPVSPASIRYAQTSPPKMEQRKPGPPLFRSSLETTREASSADEPAKPSASSKAARRVSLQPTSSHSNTSTSHQPSEMIPNSRLHTRQPISAHLRSNEHNRSSCSQHRRPGLAVHATASSSAAAHSRRASTSVDTQHLHQQPPLERRAHSSATRSLTLSEAPPIVVQKLALRPEAMPGLLVYVQATKQHLQAAIDEMGPMNGSVHAG